MTELPRARSEVEWDGERLPCPACQAQNVFLRRPYGDARHHVECRICDTRGPQKMAAELAVSAWNHMPRSQSDPASEVTELDWSSFDGPRLNPGWQPDLQELIYTALNVLDHNGDEDEDAAEQIIERLLQALRARPAAPEGEWVVVPRIPDRDMTEAGITARNRPGSYLIEIWDDMLAAAPKPEPTSAVQVTEDMVERAIRAMEPFVFREEFTATMALITREELRTALEAALSLSQPAPQPDAKASGVVATKRLFDQIDYGVDLQRIIEDLCHNRPIREPQTGARFHYDMAVKSHQKRTAAREASAGLREALEKIAGDHPVRTGRDQSDVDYEPLHTAMEAMIIARHALERSGVPQEDHCRCQNCGKPFVTDMLVTDEVWERIRPEGKPEGGGLLCPTCIMDRAASICGWTVGFVYPERHGHEVTAGRAATDTEPTT